MGNSSSQIAKRLKIKLKRKKKSLAVLCSDEGNGNYFEYLCVQNGVLRDSMDDTSGCKLVRGEIILEHLKYDDKKGMDYKHAYEEIIFSVGRSNQESAAHNTLQKSSYNNELKVQMPRKYSSKDVFTVFSCHEPGGSNNIVSKYESINSEKEENSVELEERSVICCTELFDSDLDIESLQDSLDIGQEILECCQTTGSMGHLSIASLNSVTSDNTCNNPISNLVDHTYNRADFTTVTGIVSDTGRYISSHRCHSPGHSTGNDEDELCSEGNRGSLSGSSEFSVGHVDFEHRCSGIAIVQDSPRKDALVFDAIPAEGKTGPEPFIESSQDVWNNDEDNSVSRDSSESISCIQSIDNDIWPDVNVITADMVKKDDVDSSQDRKKHPCFSTRGSKNQPTQQIEATDNTSDHVLSKLNNETSIDNYWNEFKFDSTRESNVPFSVSSFSENGIKIDIREMPNKQSTVSDRHGRLHSPSMESYINSSPFSELGIVERDLSFQQGTLARLLSNDENRFIQKSSLRWIFQYGFITQRSAFRLRQLLRHQLYPFTNMKDFWDSLSTDSPPSLEECMSVEWMRYQSFQSYPISAYGSTSRLARHGFYYTGQGTQTRCFSCGITHSDWNGTDNPHEVHQRLSPNCPFLSGRQGRYQNIPMSFDGNEAVGRASRESAPPTPHPVAPLSGPNTGPSQADRRSESIEGSGATKTIDEDNTQNLGSGETTPGVISNPLEESAQSEADNRPRFPEHITLSDRIATFSHGWPPYLDQTPQQMAEAGFFFTGNQDYTRCYQCGGGLRNWEPGDNPWIEHCRWYPMCPHVQKGKGQRFVNAVLKKQAELLAKQRADSRMKEQYGSGSTDPLETLAAITLLEMGYPRDTIRNSILTIRREKGGEINTQDVLDYIWKQEDIERKRQEEEASRPRRPGDPQKPVLPTLMERFNLQDFPAVTQTGGMKSASVSPSLAAVATTETLNTMATISTAGAAASLTSMSTSSSRSTQNSYTSGQEQNSQGSKGEAGDQRVESVTEDALSEAEVKANIHEVSRLEQQSGAADGHPVEPDSIPRSRDGAQKDDNFHSLESDEMENKDLGDLEEENKRLKEQTTCKICMENPVSVIFIPCGHLVCCETCAPAFRKCPICRKRIQKSVKTFL